MHSTFHSFEELSLKHEFVENLLFIELSKSRDIKGPVKEYLDSLFETENQTIDIFQRCVHCYFMNLAVSYSFLTTLEGGWGAFMPPSETQTKAQSPTSSRCLESAKKCLT